jgi:hypothetical protein
MSVAGLWRSDDELFAIVQRERFTCVVGDVMDKLDLQHQFLPPQIQTLRQDMVEPIRAALFAWQRPFPRSAGCFLATTTSSSAGPSDI